MNEIRKRAFVGIVGLVSAGLFSVGCSSSNSSTDGGTGAAGHVGGGTTGSGGTNGGGGSTGAGGGAVACAAAPTNGLIADFMGDGGIEIVGGLSTYSGINQPSYTVTSGNLNVMETAQPAATPQYLGAVLYFNNCVDASAFSGVEFMLGGSFSCLGGSIQYSTNDAPHDDMVTDPKGKCTLGTGNCYSPQVAITTIMSNAVQMQEAWVTTAGGAPSLPIDPTQLTGLQWQFTIPAAGDAGAAAACMASLNISDVKFYH